MCLFLSYWSEVYVVCGRCKQTQVCLWSETRLEVELNLLGSCSVGSKTFYLPRETLASRAKLLASGSLCWKLMMNSSSVYRNFVQLVDLCFSQRWLVLRYDVRYRSLKVEINCAYMNRSANYTVCVFIYICMYKSIFKCMCNSVHVFVNMHVWVYLYACTFMRTWSARILNVRVGLHTSLFLPCAYSSLHNLSNTSCLCVFL